MNPSSGKRRKQIYTPEDEMLSPEEKDETDESWQAMQRYLNVEDPPVQTEEDTSVDSTVSKYDFLEAQKKDAESIMQYIEAIKKDGYASEDAENLCFILEKIQKCTEKGITLPESLNKAHEIKEKIKENYIQWKNRQFQEDLHRETKEWYKK